jgi:hypothetical protein
MILPDRHFPGMPAYWMINLFRTVDGLPVSDEFDLVGLI